MRSRHSVAVAIVFAALAFQTTLARVAPGTWVAAKPLTTGRTGLEAAAVDGRVYAIGGTTGGCPGHTLLATEAYDPLNNTWQPKAALPQPPGKPGNRTAFATAVVDGMIYAFGGGNCLEFFRDVQVYDPTTGSWSVKTNPMPAVRANLAATALEQRIYLIGGYSNPANAFVSMSPSWEYDPSTQAFIALPAIPTPRIDPGVAVLAGKIYVVGGVSAAGTTLASVDVYDPVEGRWTTTASLLTPRRKPAVGAINGVLYAFGGSNASGILRSGEAYDPALESWDTAPSLPTERTSAGSAVLGDVLYVLGGQSNSVNLNSTTFAFTPPTPAPTALGAMGASGPYGGTTTLQATLTANGTPVQGKEVVFTLTIGGNATVVGTAVTDANGVAALNGVGLAEINAGSYAGAVAASFAGDDDFVGSSGTADLTVNQAVPEITWVPRSPIFYGTPLGSAQLNAIASYNGSAVAGTFVYHPAAGTVLPVGEHLIQETFTPADATNFMGRITTARIVVNPHPVFVVDGTADVDDALSGDGICATAAGVCTLRAAVQEANALTGADTIQLSAITITLTRTLHVVGALTVAGSGAAHTIIQGCDADANRSCAGAARLLTVQDGATLTMSGATLRNGAGGISVGVRQSWEPGYGGRAGLTLTDAAILDSTGGAGITAIGDVTVINSRIAGNRVGGSYGGFPYGGGILASPGTSLRIVNSTLSGNSATVGGAMFTNSGSAVTSFTIVGSTFSNNTALWGSAISLNGGGPYRITNTTFSGNHATTTDATVGGALFAAANADLASVTFSGNTTAAGGGAIHNYGAHVTLKNTIVANSVGPNCAGPGTRTSHGYNLSDDASCALAGVGDLNSAQDGLAPLADNGGATWTHMPGGVSAAIDAGNPAGCTGADGAALDTDQRAAGFPRATDGDHDGVPRCDIGATEGIAPLDTTPPVFTAPVDIVAEATGPDGAVVTFPSPVAVDDVDPIAVVECAPASGSTFPIGVTTVTCTATDAAANSASASFTIRVRDTTAPAISGVPPSQTLEATDPNGAAATWAAPTSSDLVSGAVAVSCSPAAGSTFPLGTTAVTCSATDGAGSSASASFTVSVGDSTAPTLTLPANITVDATSPAGAAVSFAATAADVVDGAVTVACTPASGSTFAIGSTLVHCTAADSRGNTVAGTFGVTVRAATEMATNLANIANAYGFTQSEKLLRSVLSKASSNVTAACNDLRAFMNQVSAQTGKKLTAVQAGEMTAAADGIRAALGCR